MNKEHNLIIKHSVSKGRNTYGYNLVTLRDGKSRYSTCGGGYDMIGTVFGDWLYSCYKERLKALKPCIYSDSEFEENYYGLIAFEDNPEEFYLDGGCGLSSMLEIAEKIGLRVKCVHDCVKCRTAIWVVCDERGGHNELSRK